MPAAATSPRNIVKIVMARQLLTWVFYAMCDGQVRDLAVASRKTASAGPDAGSV